MVVVSGAQICISYQWDICWIYLQGNHLLLMPWSGLLAAPICMNLILMFHGNATVWQRSPLHVPALLSLQHVGFYLAASDLLERNMFKITQSVLTSFDGSSTRFTADKEAGCPTCTVQTDSCHSCQQGWVWCCRALWYKVKLQAVSGWTNIQLCLTWWVWGEKIQEAFPRNRGVSAWMGGHQPVLRAPPVTWERMCQGRRPSWLGLVGRRSQGVGSRGQQDGCCGVCWP